MRLTTRVYMVSLNRHIGSLVEMDDEQGTDQETLKFVLWLWSKCIFSLNYDLERVMMQLLDHELNSKMDLILKFENKAFHQICVERKCLLIWDISFGLSKYLMDLIEYEDDEGNVNQDDNDEMISFPKMTALFPNL